MDKIAEIMFALLRFIFKGEEVPEEYKIISKEDAKRLYALSKNHDISHLLAMAIEKNKIEMDEDVKNAFRKQKFTAFYRSELRDKEYEKLKELLETEKINYMPMKGAIIKDLYPESWMRTSCDIDILVKEEDLDKVLELMRDRLSCKIGEKGKHDVGVDTPSGVHIEVHYRISNKEKVINKVLPDVWGHAVKGTSEMMYLMSDAQFYFYIIWHMAKHFGLGGCGVRSFIDLWLLNEKMDFSSEEIRESIINGGMEAFEKASVSLSEAWMEKKEKDSLIQTMEVFVLGGGTYGNTEQYILTQKKSTTGYIFKRLFIKKETLEALYPKLKKYPVLYPYYTVKRWTKIFIKKHGNKAVNELKLNLYMEDGKKLKVTALLDKLKIN